MKKVALISLTAAIALSMASGNLMAMGGAEMAGEKMAADTAEMAGEKAAMDTAEVVFDAKMAKRGKKTAIKQCFACHDITEDKQNRVGPPLWGVYGKPAGSVEGYEYSEAHLSKADSIVWDEATIDAYLQDPKALIPDNKMAYPVVGLPVMSEKQRKNVIEFLKSLK